MTLYSLTVLCALFQAAAVQAAPAVAPGSDCTGTTTVANAPVGAYASSTTTVTFPKITDLNAVPFTLELKYVNGGQPRDFTGGAFEGSKFSLQGTSPPKGAGAPAYIEWCPNQNYFQVTANGVTNTLRPDVCAGTTATSGWVQYNYLDLDGVYLDVNIAGCGFTSAPTISSGLTGLYYHWTAKGGSSQYTITATGFRVYVNQPGITAAKAIGYGWKIGWIAHGDTPNWSNGHGYSCTDYESRGWCCGQGACPGQEWTLGATFKHPEENCRACAA